MESREGKDDKLEGLEQEGLTERSFTVYLNQKNLRKNQGESKKPKY
jgi:hypothetical protein